MLLENKIGQIQTVWEFFVFTCTSSMDLKVTQLRYYFNWEGYPTSAVTLVKNFVQRFRVNSILHILSLIPLCEHSVASHYQSPGSISSYDL